MHDSSNSEPKTDNERKHILSIEVANLVSQGYRVESQSEFQAVLARGKRPSHLLHAILTIFTGVWALIWILLALTMRIKRVVVTVDEWGLLRRQKAT